MKSLFSRLRGNPTPPPSRPSSSASGGKENVQAQRPTNGNGTRKRPASLRRTSDVPSNAPLRSPTPLSNTDRPGPSRAQSEIVHAQDMEALGSMWESEDARQRRVSTSGEGGKKVTFRSPVPTPAPSALGGPSSERSPQPRSPDKSSMRLDETRPNPPSRASTAQSYSSRRSLSMRKTSTPYGQPFSPSPTKSPLLSPTESDGSHSTRSYLPPPNSWSEMAEEELIANLGPKERTRQEVLWEIVSSEERYVSELHKLVDTFCKALLPASAQSPSLGLYNPSETLSRTLSPHAHSPMQTPASPTETDDSHLPIAARYASSTSRTGLSGATRSASGSTSTTSPTESRSPTDARLNAYNILTNGRPSHKASQASMAQGRSHHSLPPPPRNGQGNQTPANSFSASYARMSHQSGKQVKGDRRSSTQSIAKSITLPEELETVLKVLAGGILNGHVKLAAALKKRYDDQYPLVRSLADVFTAHSYILREYATYVLHLERALTIVDESLALLPTNTTTSTTKRQSKKIEESPSLRLSYFLHSLEDFATERGESGLVISLSKPFQRLLKYPLLFQNLLFNTDPSLKEYEATLAMVDEVEVIVRTIEDEKSSSEEREKTRDVWARIEGLEKDKMLMAPKPNRLLTSETQMPPVETTGRNDTSGKHKSFKRLSDILSRSEHHDLWVVKFTDVSLVCEKTGTTSLPIHRTKTQATRSESLSDIGKREKPGNPRRGQSIRARNLYKFVKVHEWHLRQKNGSSEGLLDMREISESRRLNEVAQSTTPRTENARLPTIENSPMTTPRKSAAQRAANASSHDHTEDDKTPTKVPVKTMDGPSPLSTKTLRRRERDTDTFVSDRQSVMSFAFKGSDQIRPVQRRVKAPNGVTTGKGSLPPRATATGPGRGMTVTAANAKFANRLRSPETVHDEHSHPHGHGKGLEEDPQATIRPTSSKARRSLPPAMALQPSTNLPEQSLRNGHLLNPPRIVSNASTYSKGIKGSTPPVVAGRNISAATVKRLSLKAEQAASGPGSGVGAEPTASISGESGLALWKAYGAANPTEGTPRRVMAGRQLGGRI